MQEINIWDIEHLSIGQAEDTRAATGCTVFLFDSPAPVGVDIRGGGPASRETPLLSPVAHAEKIHAILLSGGSAFGLDAAGGVMRFLEERGIGFDTGVAKVPLVCQSALFDLGIGDKDVRPDGAMAYRACEAASKARFQQGNHGAGTGCTVGKYRGASYAMKSGIGAYAVQSGAVKIGAVVAVNAFGDIFDVDTGEQIAGLLNGDRRTLRSTERELEKDMATQGESFAGNTTLGCVFTNGSFGKAQLQKIAAMAHNGYARSICPVHTMLDGDSIYAASLGEERADVNAVGTLAAYVMARAVARGVRAAEASHGFPAVTDLNMPPVP